MRFKKGCRVEVFSKKDGPSGAWRCGEIVFSGNGHAYSVKYDYSPGKPNEDLVERVSSKAIRPYPPPVNDVSNSWTAGDVVEVFDDLYWKTAAILKVFSQNYYLVRLIGSSRELRLHKINIRVRQLWQDGKWVVIGKGSGSREYMKSNKPSTLSFYQNTSSPILQADAKTKVQAVENCFADGNDAGFQESYIVTARTLKRASPFWSSDVEACNGKALKVRAIEKKGELLQVISGCSSSFVNKVDAVAYPRECLGEMYMHTYPNNQRIASYEMERRAPNCYVESFHARNLEPYDECSVGSCSVISNSPSKLSCRILAGNSPDADALSSDAESFHGRGDEEEKCSLSLGENVAVRIHRLEMHAYRCTLEALYASGPLNWEQEVLLTNLRISLNISNDEHLMELKNLISAGPSIHIR